MNHRRRNYLSTQRELENLLPHVPTQSKRAETLLDFLDKEMDSETNFDREKFFLLLEQAAGSPVMRRIRDEICGILAKLESRSKLRMVALIRDALGATAKRAEAPSFTDSNRKENLRICTEIFSSLPIETIRGAKRRLVSTSGPLGWTEGISASKIGTLLEIGKKYPTAELNKFFDLLSDAATAAEKKVLPTANTVTPTIPSVEDRLTRSILRGMMP